MKTRHGRMLFTVALLAFAALFCVLSLQHSASARRFPLLAGALTIVMASLQFIADFRRPTRPHSAESRDVAAERSAIVWTATLVAGVYLMGLSIALPVFTAFYWRIKDRASWPVSIAVGLCVIGLVQGIFVWLLHIDLHDGIIGQWLRR